MASVGDSNYLSEDGTAHLQITPAFLSEVFLRSLIFTAFYSNRIALAMARVDRLPIS